jgi:hypothetical protein
MSLLKPSLPLYWSPERPVSSAHGSNVVVEMLRLRLRPPGMITKTSKT